MNIDLYQLLVINLLLFLLVGVGFILVHLIAGRFVRPVRPDSEKLTIYECGEPTIGSAWVQFDVRFYVVALLFVIFDVEVAFFFPWAVVFGRANELARPDLPAERRIELASELVPATDANSKKALAKFADDMKSVPDIEGTDPRRVSSEEKGKMSEEEQRKLGELVGSIDGARSLAWLAFWDIALFFAILLVGFAYLWKRGDIEWVRSVSAEKLAASGLEPEPTTEDEALVGAGKE
jgi:NADH-quinone oxidoreductase subunit A